MAAVTATLAHFPEDVITKVTHPIFGLPKEKSWLPTVKEVHEACEKIYEPILQQQLREKRVAEQMAAREIEDNRPQRPTLEQLKEKYGRNWGMREPDERPKSAFKALTLEELQHYYAKNPERVARLMGETGE